MISGKSGKIGKSKGVKRPALNVDKILNFRQKGPGMRLGMGFIGVYGGLWGSDRGFGGVLVGFLGVPWVNGGSDRGFDGFGGVYGGLEGV